MPAGDHVGGKNGGDGNDDQRIKEEQKTMPSPPFVHSKEISLHTLFKLAGELFWHCDPCVIILGHVATTPGGVCLTPAKQALTVIHISTVSALSEAVCEPAARAAIEVVGD